MADLRGSRIVLGVTGGISAYKAADLCSRLVKVGAQVNVVMTANAQRFVGAATFRALTRRRVIVGMWDEPAEYDIEHISAAESADAFLIVPATANILAKAAAGLADDMLSTMLTAARSPIIFAPAMNDGMWANAAVRSNVSALIARGCTMVEPEAGRLACGVEGVGRLADVESILAALELVIGRRNDLVGVRIMVTAGPTHEPIDPVRFIGNRSSGKMGYAVARAASDRGAQVVLVSGPVDLPAPSGVRVVRVETAAEMLEVVLENLPDCQVIVGAAAVADFTPGRTEEHKIKKSGSTMLLELHPTVDIVAEVGGRKERRVLVAFAAETRDLLENAGRKLVSKNADIIVANDVSRPGIGFGSDDNEVTLLDAGGAETLPRLSKLEIAHRILDRAKDKLGES